MAIRVLIVCLIFATGVADARMAVAADRTELLIREGVELRKQGKNEAAAQRFSKAYEQSHTPRAAAQLGLCEQALERWVEAELHLSEALTGSSDPWVAKNRKVLNETLNKARSKLSLLIVDGSQAAQVHVNGEYIGNLPDKQATRVLPGAATITATAPGYVSFQHELVAEAGKEHKVSVTLVEQPALPSNAAEIQARKDPTAVIPIVSESGAGETASSSKTWLWVAGGAAIAVAVGLVVFATSGTNYPSVDATREFPPK